MLYTKDEMKKQPKLEKIKMKKWQIRKAILEVIVLTFLSGGGSIRHPILPLLVRTIIEYIKEEKKLSIEEKKVLRTLAALEKKDLITLVEKGDSVFVHAVNEDNPEIIKYSIKTLLDFKKKKKTWNGKWFLVFFDVPEIQRNKRDYLRKFLTRLGFYRYQKSVYLFPYECEEEVKLIRKIVEGAKYMKYIVAERIEDESLARTFFKL